MKNLKKFFAMFLALCMVIGTMSLTAYADDGSYDAPWQLSTLSVRFYVYVEPGETQYVQVDDCNGTVVEVGYATGTDYMIQYGRLNPYYPEADGTMSFTLQEGGDMFSVYNSGEEAISVYMSLKSGEVADTTGTMDDPEELTLARNWFGNLAATSEKAYEAGSEGYYYYVTAPDTGLLTIGIQYAFDEEYNSIGWMYNVNSRNERSNGTYYYGDLHWSDDDPIVSYEELEVEAGEEYVIYVNTYNPENMFNAPAGTVVLNVSFSPLGSNGYPDTVETGTTDYEIEAGSNGYYVNWTAEEDGSVIVTVSGENGWTYCINGEMADGTYYYGDLHWYDDDPVVPSESIPVSKDDVLTIMVNTYSAETWSSVDGTVTLDIQFITTAEAEEVTASEEELEAVAAGSEFSGLDESKEIVISQTYGQNVLTVKEYETTTLKDVLYVSMEINLLVHGTWADYYADFAEGEAAELTLAIGEVLADAETVDVYVLSADGELTKVTACEVTDGKIALSVDTVGTYVFVDATVEEEPEETPVTPDETPTTGDTTPVGFYLALAVISLAVIVLTAKKKTVQE